MPHQCVKCSTIYDNASESILKGCTKCGGKFFFYVKESHLNKAKQMAKNLTPQDKEVIEKDVKDIIGSYLDYELDFDAPVILDFAVVNVEKPGKFQLDLVKLFNKSPMVYEVEEGKYIIDLAGTCSSFLNKTNKDSDIEDSSK